MYISDNGKSDSVARKKQDDEKVAEEMYQWQDMKVSEHGTDEEVEQRKKQKWEDKVRQETLTQAKIEAENNRKKSKTEEQSEDWYLIAEKLKQDSEYRWETRRVVQGDYINWICQEKNIGVELMNKQNIYAVDIAVRGNKKTYYLRLEFEQFRIALEEIKNVLKNSDSYIKNKEYGIDYSSN